jgi:hypothetical protein
MAPAPLVDQAVVQTCIQFCRDTQVVQSVDSQPLVAEQPDYDVDVPSGMALTSILAVWVGDTKLTGVGTDAVRLAKAQDNGPTPETGAPKEFYQKTPFATAVSIYPVPQAVADGPLLVRAAFEPLFGSTQVDDVLYDRYGDVIALGAAARLMDLPDQVFSNPAAAAKYMSLFLGGVAKARTVARSGQIRSALRVSRQLFA